MNPRTLDVAIVQAGQMTEDITANLNHLAALARSAAAPDDDGTVPDLVVLPELITTPYFCTSHDVDRTSWAQTIPGPATTILGDVARDIGCAVTFGLYERTVDGVTHNAVVLIDPSGHVSSWNTPDGGQVSAYRKLSLPANKVSGIDVDEKYHFAPGPAPATIDLFGTRFACVICYDRSFPEYWAVARASGAEVMLAIVSSLGSREDLFLAELQTRAMESQMWVVAANRAGPETLNDVTVDYFGLSCVIAPDGRIVAQAPAHRAGETLRFTLDLDLVPSVRAAFPLWRDRRAEVVELLARLTAGSVAPAPVVAPPRRGAAATVIEVAV
ncbi:carbon-nitrogen hydrolase family protein [Gordonia rhizosphera]|uniref:Putative carbon-nitrogen hydrolase n=1 Tax=Gordonia rhizosphera NBRC 16068 TaxID=1108045 RepID=K6WGC6_9ACTN|nr:carbon-nitrogen hydrolase family protein [Gordonia rhizosphera]GAB91227.1 putative carbon-nitrogen hydrolase [Gordonia rhizosphera NBRC 16068]